MASRRFSLTAVSVAFVLLAAACSKGSNTSAQGSPPSSSSSATPVTESPSPTETSPPSPTPTESPSPSASPSASPVLEDGRHFVFIKSMDVSTDPATMVFDLGYFLTGDAANEAAAAHGDETPVPNDYYIVNDNPLLRTLPIAPDVDVQVIDWMNCCELVNGTFTSFADAVAKNHPKGSYHGRLSPYWITVEGGVIVKIEEQYLP